MKIFGTVKSTYLIIIYLYTLLVCRINFQIYKLFVNENKNDYSQSTHFLSFNIIVNIGYACILEYKED